MNGTKVVYVKGAGLMQVPANLEGESLKEYIYEQINKPETPAPPPTEKEKPSLDVLQQAGAFVGSIPEGIASGVGSTLTGLGALTTVDALKRAGAGVSEFGRGVSEELLSPEQRESMGASGGRLAGNILTYLTPGVAAKVVGAAPRAALGISSLVSGLSGAGEQEERMQKAVESGAEISPEKRWALAAGAGALSAALERVPLEEFAGSGVVRKIPFIGKILGEGLDEATVKQIEKQFGGEAAKVTEELALKELQRKATSGVADYLKSGVRGAIAESPIEGLQQLSQNVLAKYGYNPEQDITEGIKESMVGGAVAGIAIKGGIDLFDSVRAKKRVSEILSEAKRQRMEAPALPETAAQTTLFARGDESKFVEGEFEKAQQANQQIEKTIDEIKKTAEPGVPLLPPSPVKEIDTKIGPISVDVAATPEQVDQQVEQIIALRQSALESAKQAESVYRQAEEAKKSLMEAKSFISENPVAAESVAKDLGYKGIKEIGDSDLPSIVDPMLEWMYRRQDELKAATTNIESNFPVASGLAQTEFNNPLSKLSDDQKIELSNLVSTQLELNKSDYQEAQRQAESQTELNKVVDKYGKGWPTPTGADDQVTRQARISQELASKPYEKLGTEEKEVVDQLSVIPGEGVKVTPEEVLEKKQFEGRPFTTAEYRKVQDELKSTPDTPVNVTLLRSKFGIKGNAAPSMVDLMRRRGDILEGADGKSYVNKDSIGPRFDMPDIEVAAKPKAQASTEPQIQVEADPKQVEFNEQVARRYAPDLVAAMKKRGVDDLFVLGIAGKIRDASGNIQPARGTYLNRAIFIATSPDGNIRTTDDMIKTLDHEIIHGMKELGMFSQNEWNILTSKFNTATLGPAREELYRKRHAGDPRLGDILKEEAVAKAASDLSSQTPERLDPVSKDLVGKVKSFLGFGRTAAQMGYKSAEDVLAAIKSGEIGTRRFTPAVEVTPQGKEVSAQREIKISKPKPLPEYKPLPISSTAPTTTEAAPKKPSAPKKSKTKKAKGDVESDPMLSLSEEAETEGATGAQLDTGEVTRAFVKTDKKEGILDRILNFFSYDKRSSFRQKFLDRYDPVREWAEKAYEKTGDIKYKAASTGAYQALLFSDRAQEIAMQGFLDGGFSVRDGILLAVENKDSSPVEIFRKLSALPASNPGFNNKLEEFFEAALARRSLDLYESGGNPGGTLTKEQLKRNWDVFEGDSNIREAMDSFKGYNDNLIDVLRKSGFISSKTANQWKKSYYIPFYRLPTVKTADGNEETGEVDLPRVGQNATNLSSPKGLTGRSLAVNDAIENIIANTYFMIGTAMKNSAALRVVRDGLEMGYMRKIERPKEAEEGTNVVTVRRDGTKEYYQVDDPAVYDAVAKSGVPVQDALKMMGKFTQVLRQGVTLSPTFILKNPVRDTLQTWVQGDLGSDLIPPINEMIKGISSVMNDSPEYKALKSAGVAGSGLRQSTIKGTADEIRKRIGLEQEGALGKLKGYLEKASEKSEAITRTQVYKDVLEKTGSESEALFAAMETINFSRRGTSKGVQIAIALLPFFNARLQGLDVFYRKGLKGEKLVPDELINSNDKKRAGQRLAYVSALSAIYALAIAGNEAWQNATDEEKDGNIFIPVDWVPGVEQGTVLKFPIPQEFGIVTKMLPERLVSMYLGQSDGPEMVDSLARAFLGTLSFDPQPQVFRPWLENKANFDFYTMKPIENSYLQKLLPEQRYTEYTPDVYKKLGETMGISPVKMEHMVRGYTGTLGAYTADVASMLFGSGKSNADPERMRLSQPYLLPVVGPLFKSSQGRKAVEVLYEIQSAAEMAVTTLRSASKGQRELSPERVEELQSMAYLDKAIQPSLKRVQTLNQMKRTVQASPELSAKEKRDLLNDIQKEMIEVAKPIKELRNQVPARYRAGLSRLLFGS